MLLQERVMLGEVACEGLSRPDTPNMSETILIQASSSSFSACCFPTRRARHWLQFAPSDELLYLRFASLPFRHRPTSECPGAARKRRCCHQG
jgi:hypothetical protein